MSTTGLPSTMPSVSNVGPGPNDTNGTVTTANSTPKATTGTSATISVRIRLFTPGMVNGPTRDRPSPVRLRPDNGSIPTRQSLPHDVAPMSTVSVMADLPFGFSSGDD